MKKKQRVKVTDLFIDIPDSIMVTRSGISDELESMHTSLTYKALSEVIGICPSHISNVLRGYANPGNRFLKALGMKRQYTYYKDNGKRKP